MVVAWIGTDGTIAWSPRASDLTTLEITVWGYVNDTVFAPPLPASLEEIRAWITEEAVTTNVDMIRSIWGENA